MLQVYNGAGGHQDSGNIGNGGSQEMYLSGNAQIVLMFV